MHKWERPVNLSAGEGSVEAVRSPFEAMIFLTEKWPKMSGKRFIRARSKCRAAVAGMGDTEDARNEFVEAAKEANILKN